MSFLTASALLRSQWLIDQKWTKDNFPLIVKIMRGEQVDFGYKRNEETQPLVLSHKAGAAYSVGFYTDLNKIPDDSVVVVTIAGPILKYGDYCSYGSVDYTALVNRLANAGNIAGIIINADTPGGQAAGTATLADAIKAASSVKPVIAIVDDGMACSAGMWIISACTEIYVTQKTDIVGSIGVYTTLVDIYGYYESQGLKARDIYAPQSTDKNLDYRNALENKDDLLKDELKVLCQQFIETVSANRQGKLTSDDWQTGKIYYAKDAQKIGLIDGIKSFGQVMDRVNSLSKSGSSKNSKSQTQYSMKLSEKFPKVASLLGLKADDKSDATGIEPHAETIEAVVTERDSLFLEKTSLQNQITAHEATIAADAKTINTLTADNLELQEKVTKLEVLDGGKPSTTSEEKDVQPVATDDKEFETSFDREAKLYIN